MSQASLQHSHFTLHPHTESKGRVGRGREVRAVGEEGPTGIDRHEREQKERSMKDQNDKEGGGGGDSLALCGKLG